MTEAKQSPLKVACVDTSTFTESIALVEGERLVGERDLHRVKGHASGLHQDLHELLCEAGWALSDLDLFVCGLGPGSFTGMRVGLAAFKGLAYALNKPLVGVTTPHALLGAAGPDALSLIDVRRGEVYAEGAPLEAPLCLKPEALIERVSSLGLEPPRALIGEGAVKYQALFQEAWPQVWVAAAAAHVPRASLLARPAIEQLRREGAEALSDHAHIASLERDR